MTRTDQPISGFRLRHTSFPGLVFGAISAVIALWCVRSIPAQDDPVALALIALIAILAGAGAVYWLRPWVRLRRREPWYLCFGPEGVRISLSDYPASDPGDMTIEIPRDALMRVRKATRPGLGDEHTELYIDLRVSQQIWSEAQALRDRVPDVFDRLSRPTPAGFLQFYENDVLRVYVSAKHWPKGLAEYWEAAGYPVGREVEVPRSHTPETIMDAPRKVF